MTVKIVAIIPAHLASVRFPRKILFPFHGMPMIEHVRRRALLSKEISTVYVATCDKEISDVVIGFGGMVIMTANTHINGTSRVAEAIKDIDCTHVILLQGDEPLLLPRHINTLAQAIKLEPDNDSWNATGPIENAEELDRHSFVKCAITKSANIIYCFRRSPCYSPFNIQQSFVRKILGLIAYRKDFLLHLTSLPISTIEKAEFIEQMRIIENGYNLKSISVNPSLPSVNEADEADIVMNYLLHNNEQRELLAHIL
ncbi:MAG: NTP transferase domain-containing protein [Desulfobacterales bacterium]|nr:NTP transferase domain-containing protein [Desulfobacterales bacterium]